MSFLRAVQVIVGAVGVAGTGLWMSKWEPEWIGITLFCSATFVEMLLISDKKREMPDRNEDEDS